MNNTPPQGPPAQGMSSESGHTLPSRLLQPTSDPSVSKRVCFYKSGDYKFSGHRMVINARTFKTFDALLDTLSKKVPLPFGVRTITTPRGTHFVKGLEDLNDGGSYVCSDQKRVKPLNLDEVNRRQVPWNTTRLFNTGRQRRPGPQPGQAAVRTPKRLTVIKNKDPMVKRTVVLQRRTAPTFEALLDYLSHILQFPVLKLYTTDGRRVDGLAALILCSGVVVAAGNEPFRLGNYSFHQASQMYMETVESGLKNFSQSSERYIVNQINASRNGSTNNNLHHNNDSFVTEINQRQMSLETCETAQADNDHCPCIVPQDNDIEKSFCVNQDGSMTVEMKVRLTIKEEEMLHWTTTLSRTSLNEAKEENHPTVTERGVGFNNEQLCQDYTSTPLEKTKPRFKRTPTPGPRHVKKSSVDSVKMVTESAVQESTMGHYSYMARTADGGTAEGYCVVRHSSSSSKRPIPRPRKTASAGTNNKGSTFSMKSTGVAEVLQIQNKGIGVRETVMHIYESQGCHDNYFANEQYSADSVPLHDSSPVPGSKPSTDRGSRLSSNDCDIDSTWQPPIADSLQRQKEEIFSLSSEPMSPAHKITNDLSSVTVNETQAETTSRIQSQHKEKVKDNAIGEKKKVIKPAKKRNTSSSSEKKQKETTISPLKNSKKSSSDKISSKASVGKKSFTSSESAKSGQKNKAIEKPQMKKFSRDEKTPSKEKALLANIENVKRTPSKNTSKAALKENGHNVNKPETKTGRLQMKKNISDFLQPERSLLAGKKTVSKPKSMTENRAPSPKKSLEMNESVSMPLLNPSPSEIHQYVENWLEKVSPDAVPYTEETDIYNSEPQKKVAFQIGGESESEEKSEKQSNPEECCPSSDGAIKNSGSCLSVPLCHEEQGKTVVHRQQMARGPCVSMPTVRVEPEHQENPLRSHKSAEAIGPAGDESSSSAHNILSPKTKMKPVLEQICSSMECIRKASDTNLEKSNSYPDFPTQVASVFGSSYKAFLSFVSVMTLRDTLTDATEDGNSEAMLMMESLQKISTIENEEEQRASLTDLQNKASSQFREHWKDFQILRERIESEAMSPKFSDTEFALEVTSEGGDVFDENQLGIDELMDELNIPQDLREEITSTIQQVKSFYLTEESPLANTAKQSPELDSTCEGENINEIMSGSEQKTELEKQETAIDFKETEQRDESLTDEENEIQGKGVENQGDDEDREDDDIEKINDVAQERGKTEQESCEEAEEKVNKEENWDTEQDEAGSGNQEEEESIEKVEETVDESEDNLKGEMETNEETDDRLTDEEDQEGSEDNSVEETDDREAVEGHTTEESEEEKGDEDEMDSIKKRDEEEENVDVIAEREEEENIVEVTEETDMDKETEDTIGERGEEEEAENVIMDGDDEERLENITGEVEEEGGEDINRDINEEEESKNITSSEEEQREDSNKEGDEETETEDDIQVRDEEEGNENITGEREQEEETEDVIEEKEEEEAEVMSKESEEEEDVNEGDEGEQEDKVEDEDGGEVEVKGMEERMITDQEEESDEGGESRKEMKTTAMSVEEESIVEEEQVDNHLKAGQTLDEEEEDEDEAGSVELNEKADNEVDSWTGGQVSKNLLLEEASYLHQRSGSCDEDQAHSHSDKADLNTESPTKYSSEGQSVKEKDKGTDSANEFETDEGGEGDEQRSLPHLVEVSQELLDFVNSALKSSSLIFTYDSQGNVRIEPDRSRTVQTKQKAVQKRRKDNSYGFKCLPSPSTSDLSDYRPESSGSGGYKTQDSLDIVTESGEEASERPFPVCRHSAQKNNIPNRKTDAERASSKQSNTSQSKSAKSFSTDGSGTKASKEDLSYFSAASSLKPNSEPAMEAAQCMSFPSEKHSPDDGVLIDQGRWLLKENHLIRKSPPVSVGMYGQSENTSTDTTSEDSPSHIKAQHSPLAAISSSELEEMAKPQTPKCTYFNMPHGSDSDPFMDDASVLSGKNCTSSFKGRGVKVSPTIDTSKTWANKNGSMSSFASVEFKVPDRKVHPEGESSAVTQPRRTSSARLQQNVCCNLSVKYVQCSINHVLFLFVNAFSTVVMV
uniref:Doublecortin domain-containing protein n=1 Tax=Sphaeramia orbicularis TaxID=375764 RepID=A0A672Z0I9_9TELE